MLFIIGFCNLQIVEILKDRPSWYRDCRNLEVFTMFPAGNGGTIELIYTQVNMNVNLCAFVVITHVFLKIDVSVCI